MKPVRKEKSQSPGRDQRIAKGIPCPYCEKALAKDRMGIGAHFRKHIRAGACEKKDEIEFLKKNLIEPLYHRKDGQSGWY